MAAYQRFNIWDEYWYNDFNTSSDVLPKMIKFLSALKVWPIIQSRNHRKKADFLRMIKYKELSWGFRIKYSPQMCKNIKNNTTPEVLRSCLFIFTQFKSLSFNPCRTFFSFFVHLFIPESRRITKVSRNHPHGYMNAWTKLHYDSIFLDIFSQDQSGLLISPFLGKCRDETREGTCQSKGGYFFLFVYAFPP